MALSSPPSCTCYDYVKQEKAEAELFQILTVMHGHAHHASLHRDAFRSDTTIDSSIPTLHDPITQAEVVLNVRELEPQMNHYSIPNPVRPTGLHCRELEIPPGPAPVKHLQTLSRKHPQPFGRRPAPL